MTLQFVDIKKHLAEIRMLIEYEYVNKKIDETNYIELHEPLMDFQNKLQSLERD